MKLNQIAFALAISLFLLPQQVFSQGGLNQRIDELSQQIATEMAEQQKTTIAVVEFTDLQGNITDLGRFIAEELITRLFQTKQFKVIERQLLNKVLSEQDLSLTGIIDPTSAKELEKILGVDAIASGTITDLAQSLRVNARLISTETGEIFAVASTEIFKDESVMRLMTAVAAPPTMAAPAPAPAVKPAAVPATPTMSAGQKFETNGFTFELVDVKKSGSNLTIQVLITNNEEDRNLYLKVVGTRIFDNVGNEYGTAEEKLQLGNRLANKWNNLGGRRYKSAENLLVSGIPVMATVGIEKVSEQTSKITLLELNCYDGEDFRAQLRDIPIPQ